MIYGDIAQQIKIVNIYSDIIHEREKLMSQRRREDPPHSEGPVHLTFKRFQARKLHFSGHKEKEGIIIG